MLISRMEYNWNNVLSPNWWAYNWAGLISGRAYNQDFKAWYVVML